MVTNQEIENHEMSQEIHLLWNACRAFEARIYALESSKPEPLTFPAIDLGMIPGDGPKHPFEPWEYTERS